ncbi:MAG: class I SAM-dependent methyltransferase [Bacteroidales bacterium]|jgi:SAM-dependent methyltransferase|nr:class I SAM-dependent methyltransferase [Bacteroidales bacterium]
MQNEYPQTFARFYDLIYHQVRNNVDHDFFIDEITRTKGKVLEIGVGTGRFFTEALNRGADIYGLDISPFMIQVLLSKLSPVHQPRITLQNIVDFHYDFQFDLIVAPFRVFMHILDKASQIKALNNVFRHLNTGGKFIIDLFIPDLKQLIQGLDHQTDFEGEYEAGKKVRRIVSTRPDLIKQLINVTFRIEWDEANTVRCEDWEIPMRFFFRYELEHLIERSDFKDYRIMGDYSGNELNEKSKEFIVICKR